MTITTALSRLDSLTKAEVAQCIQRMDAEIQSYERSIANYPPARMRRYGVPFRRKLTDRRQLFVDRLVHFK